MPKIPLPAFEGWDTPHYTPVPDQLFDDWLPHLSEAELKVLLYIMRRTFGFKKNADAISLSQLRDGIVTRDGRRLDSGAGVSERSIVRAVAGLREKGLIETMHTIMPDGGDATTIYRLHMRGSAILTDPPPQIDRPHAAKLTPPGLPPRGAQEIALQETEQEEGGPGIRLASGQTLADYNRAWQARHPAPD